MNAVESVGSAVLLIIAALFFFTAFAGQINTLTNTMRNAAGNITAPTATVPAGSIAVPQSLNYSREVSTAAAQWYTVTQTYTPYLVSAAFIALLTAIGVIIGALNARKRQD